MLASDWLSSVTGSWLLTQHQVNTWPSSSLQSVKHNYYSFRTNEENGKWTERGIWAVCVHLIHHLCTSRRWTLESLLSTLSLTKYLNLNMVWASSYCSSQLSQFSLFFYCLFRVSLVTWGHARREWYYFSVSMWNEKKINVFHLNSRMSKSSEDQEKWPGHQTDFTTYQMTSLKGK